jgi:hypothetical protein
LNWVKKQGIANFRDKDFFRDKKWVLIMDESIQFGNKKLMCVLAVAREKAYSGQAINYRDVVPVLLKSAESWKSESIAKEIEEVIEKEQIHYVVSDNGNNLQSACTTLNVTRIEDINHRFSRIIKAVYEKQSEFEPYTKQLSAMRVKLSLSKSTHIISPNQRVMNRFMNLSPLFVWGVKILKLLDKNLLSEQEKEKVSFIEEYRAFIIETNQILSVLNQVQKQIKRQGYNTNSLSESLKLLQTLQGSIGLKVREGVYEYFWETSLKMEKEESVLCSSDIIESCFGKFKEVVKNNKTVGVTDLCLCIPALLGEANLETTKQAMEKITIKNKKNWKTKNIGVTLFEKRNLLFKKVG